MDIGPVCDPITDPEGRRICRELAEEFNENCTASVGADALPLLRRLITEGMIDPLATHKLPWSGYPKKFFMFATTSFVMNGTGRFSFLTAATRSCSSIRPGWASTSSS